MIKCISYWSMKDGLSNTHPVDDALRQAKDAGFEGMEVSVGTDGVLNTQTSQKDCEKIRAAAAKLKLKVETAGVGITWGINPLSNDASTRKKSIELHAAALQRCAWLGVKSMLMVPGVVKSPISPDLVRYDHALSRLRDGVKTLLETAEKVGVELCLENVWNGLFYSPVEFAAFVDSIKSDKLGIYFDVGNVLGYHQHPPHWIELLGKRIKRIHVKDYTENFNWTGGYSFCALGAGQVPWPETMAAIRAIGYDKTLVAELLPWDPANLARTSAAMDVIMKL
ncbi:MAG: sugar phosphate isomerase/epimerase [Phycisphaeraceae bacterium]|nr:sugar phosphate isomerase/epimerase [Phycisphaeraceae bacterium]